MFRWLISILTALLVLSPPQVQAQAQAQAQAAEQISALRVQDIRLGTIADRILAANVHLCRSVMPVTGMLMHSSDQYSAPQPQWFANGPVSIADVLPGSAADVAGVRANDGLVAVGGVALDAIPTEDGRPRRDNVFDQIARSSSAAPLNITISRGGEAIVVHLHAPSGCRVLVEILADNDNTARSDGRVVQISYGMADRLSDEHLAAVFAHELAHAVLEHRRRLEEAGVKGGLLGEFGRNRRLARQVEVEADLLSVHLLANAGYDPAVAPQFWRSDVSRRSGGGLFRSGAYPSRRRRAEGLEEEIATYLSHQDTASNAEHLVVRRDLSFDDD